MVRVLEVKFDKKDIHNLEEQLGELIAIKAKVRCRQHPPTPVKTGRLIAAYDYDKDSDGYFIFNNVTYAPRIEYGFVGEDSLGRFYHQGGQYIIHNAIKYALRG